MVDLLILFLGRGRVFYMRQKIAVATVSGKAYYWLVNELNKRRIPFLSVVPGESIPPSIKVVITTKEEREKIDHPSVLIYDPKEKPSAIIDEAVRIIKGKKIYEELVVGIDPGKNFGVAVLGDGNVLEKKGQLTLEMAIDMALTALKRHPARMRRIKIGDGVPEMAEEVASRLQIAVPEDTVIEIVSEAGTSSVKGKGSGKKISDADAAINIARKESI
ncbi:hypothetical protein J7L00_04355 [Candidatus Bathyarchaeota archaeon]|nr:hypothetical protein [Candidatus Bathyarchaeota archaeon]